MDNHQGREQRGQTILNWVHERDFPGARTWYSQAVAAAKMTGEEDLSELVDTLKSEPLPLPCHAQLDTKVMTHKSSEIIL